jgi:hypothetical protein
LAPNHITIYGAPYVSYVKKIILFPGKIIANISLFPETHSTLFSSGWVGILAEWARNSNLLISLPASKALSNLDQKYGKCTYSPGIYLVSPNDRVVQHQNELSNRGVDIVLLHGLLGGVFFTWRQHDKVKERSWTDPNLISSKDYTYCWPRDWLIEDGLDDGRVRIIGVDCKYRSLTIIKIWISLSHFPAHFEFVFQLMHMLVNGAIVAQTRASRRVWPIGAKIFWTNCANVEWARDR